MRKKKIAICSVQIPFVKGGAENLIESFQNELSKRNFEVTNINIPFKWYPVSRIITECMIWRLIDISEVNGWKVDMVISTKFPSTIVKHDNKRIWLIHQLRQAYDMYGTEYSFFDNSEEQNRIRKLIIKIDTKTINEAKEIFTISKTVTNRLKKYNDIDSIHIYPPPKNHERFYCDQYENYILYVGRLESIKRVRLLLESFRFVKSDTQCIIVGNGDEKDNCQKYINNHGLRNKVKLLGFLSDDEVIKLYANALGVFYAPIDEDYGFATIEAFLSKKPIITTNDAGGVLEFVIDEENGFITEANPVNIADKIDMIRENKAKCKELGMNGYEIARKITWDYVIDRIIQ